MTTPPTNDHREFPASEEVSNARVHRLFFQVIGGLIALALVGFLVAGTLIGDARASNTFASSNNMFYHLFATYDRWYLVVFAITALVFVWILRTPDRAPSQTAWPRLTIAQLALLVALVAAAGTHLVFQNYPFAMDEFFSDFQAQIFAQGRLWEPISAGLGPIAHAATPLMATFNPATNAWTSNYLPVYSLLRVPFWLAGCSWLVNPLLAGASVFALAGVIRKIWPDVKYLQLIGALLLASSPQFLITSMTAYAMPAHVCVNLFWLWLFLRNDRLGFWLTPCVGIAALGLHQPNIHFLFVAPFILRLLWTRRWKIAVYYLSVYAAGSGFWLMFMKWKALPAVTAAAAAKPPQNIVLQLAQLFTIPDLQHLLDHLIAATQILAWNSFVLVLFSALALFAIRKQPPVIADLLAGMILALDCFLLFPENQGHGWGNRYFYSFMGSFVLLGVAGFQHFRTYLTMRQLGALATLSLVAFCVQLPLYAWSCYNVVAPFAAASEYIHSRPVETVILDSNRIWYGQDLVRNSPGLTERPLVLFLRRLDPKTVAMLEARKNYQIVNYNDLVPLGMHPVWIKFKNAKTASVDKSPQ